MKQLLILCVFMLSACGWERQIALHPGDANITSESICVSSSGGKKLSFYSVDSRKLTSPNEARIMLVSKYIDTQTPYCFKLKLEPYMSYSLYYKVDDKAFSIDFITDHTPVVFKRVDSN